MRIVVLFVAVLVVAVGVVGTVAPDSVTELRRAYVVTPRGLYVMDAVRVVIGLLLILSAAISRTPKTLRAILEWEAAHTGLLRIGTLMALAAGTLVVFTVINGPGRSERILRL